MKDLRINICLLAKSLILISILSSAPAHRLFADVATLEKEIQQLDSKIAVRKSSLAKENASMQTELEEAEKILKSGEKRAERQGRKIERAQERLTFVQSSIRELDSWFNGLGAIDQGLNSGNYETKKNALNVDLNTAQSELKGLQQEKAVMDSELSATQKKVDELNLKLKDTTANINSDKQIRSLVSQREAKVAELGKLKKELETQATKNAEPTFKAYVFAISSSAGGSIEKTLKLKSWVESYGAKYVEANWNGMNSKSTAGGSMLQLLGEFDEELKKIPKDSKVILIGYGLGGGAAVLMATEVAQKQGRDIEYLITLDPMGVGETRMNAVYTTESFCQAKISPEQYVNCLSGARKRVITSNVKNFYNRWQRESVLPIDAKDRMNVGKQEFVLATGKFKVEATSTKVNQMRIYYDDKNAHERILADAAAELPKVLLPHLR